MVYFSECYVKVTSYNLKSVLINAQNTIEKQLCNTYFFFVPFKPEKIDY